MEGWASGFVAMGGDRVLDLFWTMVLPLLDYCSIGACCCIRTGYSSAAVCTAAVVHGGCVDRWMAGWVGGWVGWYAGGCFVAGGCSPRDHNVILLWEFRFVRYYTCLALT